MRRQTRRVNILCGLKNEGLNIDRYLLGQFGFGIDRVEREHLIYLNCLVVTGHACFDMSVCNYLISSSSSISKKLT